MPSRRRLLLLAAALGLSVILLVAAVVEVPYYAVGPGQARPLNHLVEAPGQALFASRGTIILPTTSLRPTSALLTVWFGVSPDFHLVPAPRIVGGSAPPPARRRFQRDERETMALSKDMAVVVALRRLGHAVPERGDGATVIVVAPGSPADGRLRLGDVITSVDGAASTTADRAQELLGADMRPHRLDVVAEDGSSRVEEIMMESAASSAGPVSFLGASLRTENARYRLPFAVRLAAGELGGTSGGLAFALSVLDVLSEGELTGGRSVAATGTLALDGTVGGVDALEEKAVSARRAGATHFLVPPAGRPPTRAPADLTVVEVVDLDDAIAALVRLGGQAPPVVSESP